jgi:aminopeptidase N
VADYVPRYFTEVPAMTGWVGEDALSRVVFLGFPKVFTEETARLSAETLERSDLTPAVRRSLVDADWELQEALGSRRTFQTTP